MGFEKDSLYSSEDFIALKNRVKTEMLRRDGHGSLASYGGSSYNYSQTPDADEHVDSEHYSKIRDLQTKINTSGLPEAKAADSIVEEMTILEAKQTVFESQPRGARTGNDCNSACTGVCVTTCSTGCTSCTGCSGCSSCTGGCSGCSGCGGACSNSCSGGCSSCSGCSGCSSCSGGCTSCTNYCSKICTGCSGCGGNCSGSCGSQCAHSM